MPTISFSGFSRCATTTVMTLIIGALAACGGGSDAPAPTTAATTTFPLAAAMANYAKDTRTVPFTLSGTGTSGTQTIPFTGSGSFSSTIVPGTFEGAVAQVKTSTTTGTLTAQGTSSALLDKSIAFYDSNFQPVGTSSASNYCVNSGSAGLPASAKIGDTGTWYSTICYTNSTKSVRLGTNTLTYVMEPLDATSALLKVTQKVTSPVGTIPPLELTYTITTAGLVSPRETPFVLTRDGVTVSLVFRFL